MLPIYEAANIDATWLDIDIAEGGAGDDTFLEITPVNDMLSSSFGADGMMGISKMAGKGGTISMTLKQTAPLNAKLARVAAAQMATGAEVPVAPFTVVDKTGGSAHFVALNAVLQTQADHSFGNAMGEKTWVWVCEAFIPTDDPIGFTASLVDYIKGS